MSTVNRELHDRMAMCSGCEHDLIVRATGPKGAQRSGGKVYCSNADCRFSNKAHKTGAQLNAGPVAA